MSDLNLPVLIYVALEGCSACAHYNQEWEKVKQSLQGRARFVKFMVVRGSNEVPPCLSKYVQSFPSVILAGPKSYFRCFTHDDQINREEYTNNYTIRAKKFNSIETPKGLEYMGRPNTAENTLLWFNQVVGTVPQYDEINPPRKYSTMFPRNFIGNY